MPGCLANEPEYIGGYVDENLMETVVEEEESVTPPSSRVVIEDDAVVNIGVPSNPTDDGELCICDWEVVEQSSLVCLAIVCSETCAPDEIPCNASQRVCYPF